jgi:hypothetical protein
MPDDNIKRGTPDAETAESKVKGDAPFQKSRSAGDYDPDSNWAAERRIEDVKGKVRGSTERLVDQSTKAVENGRTPQRTEPDREEGAS